MHQALTEMRRLVAKPMWFAQVASMSVDEDGDIDAGEILATAAFTVCDEATSLEIAMATQNVIVSCCDRLGGVSKNAQDFVLKLIDEVIRTTNKEVN